MFRIRFSENPDSADAVLPTCDRLNVRFGSKADIDRDLLTDNFQPWLALGAIQNYSRIYIDIEKILFLP